MVTNLLQNTENLDECVQSVEGAHRRTYVNAMLRTVEGGPVLRTRVMIDQGNTLHSGVAMSQELHRKLGGLFERLGGRAANTAKKGAKLRVIGQSRPLYIKFGLQNRKFMIKPTIIEAFGDAVNIGSQFLQQHGCQLKFSKNGTTMVLGEEEIPLIKMVQEGQPEETAREDAEEDPDGYGRPQKEDPEQDPKRKSASSAAWMKSTKVATRDCHGAQDEVKSTRVAMEKACNEKQEDETTRQGREGHRGTRPKRRETSRGGNRGGPVVCEQDIIVKKDRLTFVRVPKMRKPGVS